MQRQRDDENRYLATVLQGIRNNTLTEINFSQLPTDMGKQIHQALVQSNNYSVINFYGEVRYSANRLHLDEQFKRQYGANYTIGGDRHRMLESAGRADRELREKSTAKLTSYIRLSQFLAQLKNQQTSLTFPNLSYSNDQKLSLSYHNANSERLLHVLPKINMQFKQIYFPAEFQLPQATLQGVVQWLKDKQGQVETLMLPDGWAQLAFLGDYLQNNYALRTLNVYAFNQERGGYEAFANLSALRYPYREDYKRYHELVSGVLLRNQIMTSHLTTQEINLSNKDITSGAFHIVYPALKSQARLLCSIDLSQNQLQDAQATQLIELLQINRQLTIQAQGNGLSTGVAAKLTSHNGFNKASRDFQQLPANTFEWKLTGYGLQDEQWLEIMTQYSPHFKQLRVLDASGNQLSEAGVNTLLNFISHNRTLKALNLSDMPLDTEQAERLAKLVIELELRELTLKNCQLVTEAMQVLENSLTDSKWLQRLNLSGNAFDHEACRSLANIIKHNHSLTSLSLESIGVRQAKSMKAQSQPIQTRLVNAFDGSFRARPATAQIENQTYRALEQRSIQLLLEALETNPCLNQLWLKDNHLHRNDVQRLQNSLDRNISRANDLLTFVRRNDSVQLQQVLAQGVNVSYCDKDGNTALHFAITSGHKLIIQTLLQNLTPEAKQALLAKKNKQKQTPQDIAKRSKDKELANWLKEIAQPQPSAKQPTNTTPLAERCRQLETLLKSTPDDLALLVELGESYQQQAEKVTSKLARQVILKKAVTYLQRVLEIDPFNEAAEQSLQQLENNLTSIGQAYQQFGLLADETASLASASTYTASIQQPQLQRLNSREQETVQDWLDDLSLAESDADTKSHFKLN
jgi:hypothetical protein